MDAQETLTYARNQNWNFLDYLLRYPRMFGSQEAIEFQFLLALETHLVLVNPEADQEESRWVLNRYHKFLRTMDPGGCSYMSAWGLPWEEFTLNLTRFRDDLVSSGSFPPSQSSP